MYGPNDTLDTDRYYTPREGERIAPGFFIEDDDEYEDEEDYWSNGPYVDPDLARDRRIEEEMDGRWDR